MIRTAPQPYNLFIGAGLILLSVAIALSPLATLYRSVAILFCAYLAFSNSGTPAAYIIVLFSPLFGLRVETDTWLVLLPVMLSTNLLAMLGLDYGWRYGAIVLSPVLAVLPVLIAWQGALHPLFNVTLPWQPDARTWIVMHTVVALAGVVIGLALDYKRARATRR
jgi:hypothetical protein